MTQPTSAHETNSGSGMIEEARPSSMGYDDPCYYGGPLVDEGSVYAGPRQTIAAAISSLPLSSTGDVGAQPPPLKHVPSAEPSGVRLRSTTAAPALTEIDEEAPTLESPAIILEEVANLQEELTWYSAVHQLIQKYEELAGNTLTIENIYSAQHFETLKCAMQYIAEPGHNPPQQLVREVHIALQTALHLLGVAMNVLSPRLFFHNDNDESPQGCETSIFEEISPRLTMNSRYQWSNTATAFSKAVQHAEHVKTCLGKVSLGKLLSTIIGEQVEKGDTGKMSA